MRDGFVFYASWLEAIKNLPRDIQGEVLTAIIEYGLYGETTESPKPITSAMLAMVKPQIDINNKRYENGKKGGRPRKEENQNITKQKPKHNQTITKEKPNRNQTETNIEPKDKDKDKYKEKETTTKVVAKKDAAKAALLSRENEFYESLVPYVDTYGKEMIRAFFDYWSQTNKSGTKMGFEMEKKWDLAKRLSLWASREKQYSHGSTKNTTKQEANEYAMQKLAERIEQREQGVSSEVQDPW